MYVKSAAMDVNVGSAHYMAAATARAWWIEEIQVTLKFPSIAQSEWLIKSAYEVQIGKKKNNTVT